MSPKSNTIFSCTNCSYQSIKWMGVCPECRTWGSLEEEESSPIKKALATAAPAKHFDQISESQSDRIHVGVDEWDRVMGGGIMPASFLILTGDPGIGKSTLLLQIASKLSDDKKVLYFATEESLAQIKQRACRIGLEKSKILLSEDRDFETISGIIDQERPDLAIIDSVQSCFLSSEQSFSPGSLSQLKEISFRLMQLAKGKNVAILITGHITKDGSMAGPKLLEHMVDGVFYLHGEQTLGNRILTATKNRFGPVGEIGFFQMSQDGLEPVEDVNNRILRETVKAPGSSLSVLCQGTRSVIVEFQALCVRSKFGQPQRIITGTDYKRVVLIAAILEKHLKMSFSSHDIFFKVGGGVWTKESSSDLAIAIALVSSYLGQAISKNCLSVGEVSLTGQITTHKKDLVMAEQISKTCVDTIIVGKTSKSGQNLTRVNNVFELLKLFPREERSQRQTPSEGAENIV